MQPTHAREGENLDVEQKMIITVHTVSGETKALVHAQVAITYFASGWPYRYTRWAIRATCDEDQASCLCHTLCHPVCWLFARPEVLHGCICRKGGLDLGAGIAPDEPRKARGRQEAERVQLQQLHTVPMCHPRYVSWFSWVV